MCLQTPSATSRSLRFAYPVLFSYNHIKISRRPPAPKNWSPERHSFAGSSPYDVSLTSAASSADEGLAQASITLIKIPCSVNIPMNFRRYCFACVAGPIQRLRRKLELESDP